MRVRDVGISLAEEELFRRGLEPHTNEVVPKSGTTARQVSWHCVKRGAVEFQYAQRNFFEP